MAGARGAGMDKDKAKKPAPPQKPQPRSDSDPFIPVYDKKPSERTPREIREAIEGDAVLERRDEHSR